MKDNLPEGITQEMVDNAKTKYNKAGEVKLAELPTDDDGNSMHVLIRRPNRQVLSEYSKWADKSPSKADDILVNSCLLSHKDIVKADDLLLAVCVDAIAQTIIVRKAIVKNI